MGWNFFLKFFVRACGFENVRAHEHTYMPRCLCVRMCVVFQAIRLMQLQDTVTQG